MMHARFVLSFDVLRSVESVYNNVYCCPGALTALRASAARQVLDDWRKQTFLGSACTFGEDRAMTNYLLDKGYNTAYQRLAIVHTVVPETYRKLSKMLLRWDRSYVREEIRFARIIWKRPVVTMLIALFDRAVTDLRYPVYYLSLGILIFLIMQDPVVFIRFFVAIGLFSFANMLYFLRSERSWGFLYGVVYACFSTVALFWIFPYAPAAVRAKSWLTR
jgi:hyaluronan synthase